MLRRIDRVILRVPSIEGAVHYYRDVLGMALLRQDGRLASFRLGSEGELILHNDPDLQADAVYYLVDDVRELYRRRERLKLRFVSPPSPVSRGYRATVRDPFDNVLLLLDRGGEEAGSGTIEDAKAPGTLFAGIDTPVTPRRDVLIQIYEKLGRTADDLPYTPHFESLYSAYTAQIPDPKPTRQEVWRHLLNLRKGSKLPKLGPARSVPPEITDEAKAQLRTMLGEDIGKRDRLPYTQRFDELVDQFNRTQSRPLSPHLVWRLVATIAK